MLRLALLAIVIGAAAWFGGVFDSDWSRTVDRPPAAVIDSLGGFQLSDMEGSPGSNPEYAGGASTVFAAERSDAGWVFTARTGGQVSMTFYADVVDLGDGRSEVRARVERGVSPEDRTPAMFTDESITLTMFGAALDDRLDALTMPQNFSAVACGRILARLSNEAPPGGHDLERGSFGERARSIDALGSQMESVEAELHANGCSKDRMEANQAAVMQAMDDAQTSGPFGAGPDGTRSAAGDSNAPQGARARFLAEHEAR